jgi:hypothetical protein
MRATPRHFSARSGSHRHDEAAAISSIGVAALLPSEVRCSSLPDDDAPPALLRVSLQEAGRLG